MNNNIKNILKYAILIHGFTFSVVAHVLILFYLFQFIGSKEIVIVLSNEMIIILEPNPFILFFEIFLFMTSLICVCYLYKRGIR